MCHFSIVNHYCLNFLFVLLVIESIPVKHTTKSSKFKWARNDLDDELASMYGTNDVAEEQMKLIDRPEETIDSHVRRSTSPGPSTSRTAVNIPTKVDTGLYG